VSVPPGNSNKATHRQTRACRGRTLSAAACPTTGRGKSETRETNARDNACVCVRSKDLFHRPNAHNNLLPRAGPPRSIMCRLSSFEAAATNSPHQPTHPTPDYNTCACSPAADTALTPRGRLDQPFARAGLRFVRRRHAQRAAQRVRRVRYGGDPNCERVHPRPRCVGPTRPLSRPRTHSSAHTRLRQARA